MTITPSSLHSWASQDQIPNSTQLHPSRLPLEVYELIIDQLHDDPLALEACALTCRAWLPRSRFRLFLIQIQHVPTVGTYNNLLRRIRASPSLPQYVRALCVSRFTNDRKPTWTNRIPVQLAPFMSRLFCLHFQDVLSSGWMHPSMHAYLAFFRTVGNLSLGNCLFSDINSFIRILLCFPALEYLTLDQVRWGKSQMMKHLVGPSRSKKFQIKSLAITLDSWHGDSAKQFTEWFMTTPSVSTVTFFSLTSGSATDHEGIAPFYHAVGQSLKELEIYFPWYSQGALTLVSGKLHSN